MTKCTAGVGLRTCVFFRCCRSDSFLTGREILSHAESLGCVYELCERNDERSSLSDAQSELLKAMTLIVHVLDSD